MIIPIEISARHIHLSQKDLEILFGEGYQLKKKKQLTQPSDFAAQETLDIKGKKNVLKNVRIVGPVREKTQVELSITDALFLDVKIIFKDSGDLKDTPGIILVGPKGELKLTKGVIVPLRHIHCNIKEAQKLGLKNGQFVSVLIEGKRKMIFHNVKVRVRNDYKLCVHLDTDEGNAAGIIKKGKGILLIS